MGLITAHGRKWDRTEAAGGNTRALTQGQGPKENAAYALTTIGKVKQMAYMNTEIVNESRRAKISILSTSVSSISASKVEHFSARSPQVPGGLVPR